MVQSLDTLSVGGAGLECGSKKWRKYLRIKTWFFHVHRVMKLMVELKFHEA